MFNSHSFILLFSSLCILHTSSRLDPVWRRRRRFRNPPALSTWRWRLGPWHRPSPRLPLCGTRPARSSLGVRPRPHSRLPSAPSRDRASSLGSGRQKEEVLDEGRLLQPTAKRAGETLPDPEVHHQTGSEAAGRKSRTHGRTGTRGISNKSRLSELSEAIFSFYSYYVV